MTSYCTTWWTKTLIEDLNFQKERMECYTKTTVLCVTLWLNFNQEMSHEILKIKVNSKKIWQQNILPRTQPVSQLVLFKLGLSYILVTMTTLRLPKAISANNIIHLLVQMFSGSFGGCSRRVLYCTVWYSQCSKWTIYRKTTSPSKYSVLYCSIVFSRVWISEFL